MRSAMRKVVAGLVVFGGNKRAKGAAGPGDATGGESARGSKRAPRPSRQKPRPPGTVESG